MLLSSLGSTFSRSFFTSLLLSVQVLFIHCALQELEGTLGGGVKGSVYKALPSVVPFSQALTSFSISAGGHSTMPLEIIQSVLAEGPVCCEMFCECQNTGLNRWPLDTTYKLTPPQLIFAVLNSPIYRLEYPSSS